MKQRSLEMRLDKLLEERARQKQLLDSIDRYGQAFSQGMVKSQTVYRKAIADQIKSLDSKIQALQTEIDKKNQRNDEGET